MAENDIETELMALDHCVKALEVLKDDALQRAIRYLNDRFRKIEPPPQQAMWTMGGTSSVAGN